MRDDILEAAIRVLPRDGALKFTTWRVAEVAGVSVGSLYQYFPNKQSIIYAIHSAKVERTWVQVQRILDSPASSARQKVRRIARLFFLVESSEVTELGASLHEAEIYFASQPEHKAKVQQAVLRFERFVKESLPQGTTARQIAVRTRLLMMAIETFGKTVAEEKLSRRRLLAWAQACADVTSNYIGLP